MEIVTFSPANAAEMLELVNGLIGQWPYCRKLDGPLLEHWGGLGERYQPRHMLLGRDGGRGMAFAHGQRSGKEHFVHLLALPAGGAAAGAELLGRIEQQCRQEGVGRIIGPTARSALYYGGYVLGREPYLPHWCVQANEAFTRAGYLIASREVVMIATARTGTPPGRPAAGYEVAEAPMPAEYDAQAFRHVARSATAEAATCGARFYPHAQTPSGQPFGQIGHVETMPEHRNRGLATLLTQVCLRRLLAMGADEVLITTSLDNPPALKAYEKAGFQRRFPVFEWVKQIGG